MKNKKQIFESDHILKAILQLALPSVMGQIILVIYNLADTLFVGMSRSDEMITAITVCMPAFMFLSAISNLFGVGAASVIARALGCNETGKAKRASSFAFWGCALVTLLYCAGAMILCDGFVDLLGGTNRTVHVYAVEYMRIAIVAGGLCTALNTLFSHLIRAYGFSAQASIGVGVGGILNIVLDPVFMFVLLPSGNEIMGAALATAISNFCTMVYYAVFIRRSRGRMPFSLEPSKAMLQNGIPGEVLKVGSAAFLMTLLENVSYAILDKLIGYTGTAAQAGIGVAKKVNMLAHCFVRGMSQGVLPLIAYNYASGNKERMKKAVCVSASISVGIAVLCTAVSFLLSRPLISLFIHVEGDSLHYGIVFLRILCLGAPFSAFAYAAISFFQATGHGGRSTILAMLRKGILDISLMFALRSVIPPYGIVSATPVTDIICCAAAVCMFVRFIRRYEQNTTEPPPMILNQDSPVSEAEDLSVTNMI